MLYNKYNKAVLLSFIVVLILPICNIICNYFNINISLGSKYIAWRTYLHFTGIVFVSSSLIYFLIQISAQKAILNYIQTNEITYDKYLFFKLKLHTKFGLRDNINSSKSNSLEKLFETIESYMKQSRPWLDPDYSIEILARDLKSNTLYISQAINLYAKTNFKSYLNDFRLNAFIMEWKNSKDKSVSFKEIYMDVGFNNHVTFNRVFKTKFDMTPQEYIKKHLDN